MIWPSLPSYSIFAADTLCDLVSYTSNYYLLQNKGILYFIVTLIDTNCQKNAWATTSYSSYNWLWLSSYMAQTSTAKISTALTALTRPASADRTARRQFQATGQPMSRTQVSDAMMSRLPCYEAKCVQRRCFQCQSLCIQISRERSYPLPVYWYHSKGNWLRYNFAADSFYIIKLCSRLFFLYCWNCPKDDKFRYFIPILRKLGAA